MANDRTASSIDWLKALETPRLIRLRSDRRLVDAIRKRQKKRRFEEPVGLPEVVPELNGLDTEHIRPINLLRAMGVITTPDVPNLVDLSSQWSIYRYIWAFDPTKRNGPLRLSESAKNIDFHQKGLLSDHMGVGITEWLMEHLFRADTGVDVAVALTDSAITASTGIRKRGRQSPDYLFELSAGQYALVESKGTQSGRSVALDQMRRGLEQLAAIEFGRRVQARAFVVGISLSKSRKATEVNVVEMGKLQGPDGSLLEEDGERDRLLSDDVYALRQRVREAAHEIQAGKLLTYAGAEGAAARVRRSAGGDQRRQQPPREHRVPELNTIFVGQAAVLPLRGEQDYTVEVFQGLDEETFEHLAGEQFRRQPYGERRVAAVWHRARERSNQVDTPGSISFRGDNGQTLSSVAEDGSLLQIRFRT